MIGINKPYLEKGENSTRLCCNVLLDDKEYLLWYEVDNKYAEYLCYEKADSFLIAVLPFAMAFNHDIKVIDVPISERIMWQLKSLYIPALAKFSNYYKKIDIISAVSTEKYDSFAVGTGFSAGVDSFFTLLSNRDQQTTHYNITHAVFLNVGANGSFGGNDARERYHTRISLYENYLEENGYEFVCVDSNVNEFSMMSYNYVHTFMSLSAILAMQKLFCVYYYSGADSIESFSFDPSDSAHYDLFNTQLFSTESVVFYSTGVSESRIEKTEFISNYHETYSLLNVCNANDTNCRTCEKCVRTMSGLYAIGKLENYSKVFDVDYFIKHLSKNLAFMLAKGADGSIEGAFCPEIFEKMKENKKQVPIMTYFYFVPYWIKFVTINFAKKNKTLKKWWHRKCYRDYGVRYNDIDE